MRFLLLLLTIAAAGQAVGHEVRPAFLRLVQTGPERFDATFKQPQIQGRFLDLAVSTNCSNVGRPTASVDNSAFSEQWAIHCDGGELLSIDIEGLHRTMIDTLVRIEYADGRTTNHLVEPAEPRFEVKKKSPRVPVYLVMGIRHLLFGYDHLLFVIVLMFVVRGWANLFKAVTSFTAAHSITLGLSAFNIIAVNQSPVEASIALSILVLSVEAFQPGTGNPWPIAFVFGLLHGLGFAGALHEIGLPADSALWALAFFNMGIELGQLAIIALVLTVIYLLRRLPWELPRWTGTVPLFVAGSIAGYWLIQRTVQMVS